MEAVHAAGEMYLYFAVKLPLYAYESLDDVNESLPYYRTRWAGILAKIRRLTLG